MQGFTAGLQVTAFHGDTNRVEVNKSRPSIMFDRSADDGYNWRKYGQKVVKGSEFPRSYYKCTYPKCEVKKIFERSYTGQITEILYKGEHDHPKPHLNRLFPGGDLFSIPEDNEDTVLSVPDRSGFSATNVHVNYNETYLAPMLSPKRANDDSINKTVPKSDINNDGIEDDVDLKKRRINFDVIPVVKPIREARVVVQTISEIDILDDGYRWRKYGQKVVRCNPNPRSYYKCTSAGCSVRKHVERASHDPKAVLTTYEGKHSHDVAVPTTRKQNSMIRSNPNGVISLDLVVGNRF